jgi:hypothetical protein
MRTVVALWILAGVAMLDSVAAPVPPPPRQLTPELLVGTWRYEYGDKRDGSITFHADGSYSARHEPDSTLAYCGTWSVDG